MHLGRVIGKYRLERKLGHGAMGDVFLGVHVELGSFVAVKILNAAACAEPNGIARFLNEAKAVAAIDHEQIARVIDQDQLPDGTPYIVMEFVEGVTLRELLDQRGALGLRLTVELLLDVLSALSVAHARGIVHRDLKPENVRVTKGGRAKILDFGIAKVLSAVPTPLTQVGMLVGTPYYMSPEQIGGGQLDGRSDLYALGVILFECVTGQRPFEGSTVVALLNRHLHEPPVSPRSLRAELTPALDAVILRALEKQPDARFNTAEEFSTALKKAHGELPADGPVVSRVRLSQEVATPSLSQPQGTTEDALQHTVRTPLTRRFRMPLPLTLIGLVAAGLLLWLSVGLFAREPAIALVTAPLTTATVAPQPPAPGQPPAPATAPAPDPATDPDPDPGPAPARARLRIPAAPAPAPASEPEPAREPEPAPARGVTLIETATDRRTLPIDFDPRAFDPLAWLPRAQALARATMPDAVLTTFEVSGLFTGNTVDFTASREFHADYYFRSPAKSVTDPRLRDEDQDIPCLHYVTVSAKKIETHTADSFRGCREKPLPRIACSLSDAFRQAKADGLKDPAKAMSISWLSDGWYFNLGDDAGSMSVNCP